MATKNYLELQELDDADLRNNLQESKTEYQKLKFDHTIKGLDNPLMLRDVRRQIARLKSEVRRRELKNMSEEDIANRSKIRARRKKQ